MATEMVEKFEFLTHSLKAGGGGTSASIINYVVKATDSAIICGSSDTPHTFLLILY